jgi:hypothetical protein
VLQRDGFTELGGADTVWWRPRGAAHYRPFPAADLAALREQFTRAGTAARLG